MVTNHKRQGVLVSIYNLCFTVLPHGTEILRSHIAQDFDGLIVWHYYKGINYRTEVALTFKDKQPVPKIMKEETI